jgi:hypothetical protein
MPQNRPLQHYVRWVLRSGCPTKRRLAGTKRSRLGSSFSAERLCRQRFLTSTSGRKFCVTTVATILVVHGCKAPEATGCSLFGRVKAAGSSKPSAPASISSGAILEAPPQGSPAKDLGTHVLRCASDRKEPWRPPVTAHQKWPLVCVFCGAAATTRDHVPPKSIFVELELSNLVTVPSCERCNNAASQFDERFRNTIAMRASEAAGNAAALWGKAWRSLRRNRWDLETLARSLRDVAVTTESGLYTGRVTEAAFEAEPHDRTIQRITRGLYFHHLGKSLPYDAPIEVFPIRDGTDLRRILEPFLMHMQAANIGGHAVFEYVFTCAADEQRSSLWVYRFYEWHMAAAFTGTLTT